MFLLSWLLYAVMYWIGSLIHYKLEKSNVSEIAAWYIPAMFISMCSIAIFALVKSS